MRRRDVYNVVYSTALVNIYCLQFLRRTSDILGHFHTVLSTLWSRLVEYNNNIFIIIHPTMILQSLAPTNNERELSKRVESFAENPRHVGNEPKSSHIILSID